MQDETVSFTLLELFKMGGPFMWPLLLFSIASIFISVERAIYFIYHNLHIDDMTARISEQIVSRDYTGAQEYLSSLVKRRMGARILLALVKHSARESGATVSEHRLERAVETEAASCTTELENGLNFLTALGSLSPLTGFLGTVSGMISAFKSIAEATEVNAQIVANGIYEALITTVFGLIIAIIAMISHSIFTFIVDKFTAEVERNCSQCISEIVEQHDA
jgi:biopolymer transport protein ExbB